MVVLDELSYRRSLPRILTFSWSFYESLGLVRYNADA